MEGSCKYIKRTVAVSWEELASYLGIEVQRELRSSHYEKNKQHVVECYTGPRTWKIICNALMQLKIGYVDGVLWTRVESLGSIKYWEILDNLRD
jgi:hypothetical protein